jgi:nitrogen fixation protein FixH
MSDAPQKPAKNPKDKWIPIYFVIFFAVVALLDGFFVYKAVSTQTGLVTEHAYKKGLAYNDVLAKAKSQPRITQKPSYQNGTLRWQLIDENGQAITNADVTAKIIRPVQSGYDYKLSFAHHGQGIYEAAVNAPLTGHWVAELNGQWDEKSFQTSYDFVTK